jgi:predicted nucleic acid-binding protein
MISDTQQVSETKALLKIAVNDANLFIDLCEVELIETFFQLPLEFHTTQLILNELEPEQKKKLISLIEANHLKVRYLTRDEIDGLDKISVNSRKLSREDLSVYFYAKELMDCMILTGDNRLRKEAQRQGFEVHGILWVFEQLLENQLIEAQSAIELLRNLMNINLWLPMGECEKLIEKWTFFIEP